MRPALRYYGGKWRIAPWIIGHFPKHKVYVEPYGGAASVLLRKPRSYGEVYNDLDEEIVNLFRVLRDRGGDLQRLLTLTPFSRIEMVEAYKTTEDRMERARKTIIKSFQGFGSDTIIRKSGFRNNSDRSGTTPSHDWVNYANHLNEIIERLQGVVIEKRDAFQVMKDHDDKTTLHYVDPPYIHSTRAHKEGYRYEMEDEKHVDLAKFLKGLKGSVVVSAYESPIYNRLYRGWQKDRKQTYAGKAKKTTEVIWMNFKPNNQLF